MERGEALAGMDDYDVFISSLLASRKKNKKKPHYNDLSFWIGGHSRAPATLLSLHEECHNKLLLSFDFLLDSFARRWHILAASSLHSPKWCLAINISTIADEQKLKKIENFHATE